MIQKISFKNYKAFEQGEFNIKPITIFLGANSVGKSSLMQLLLLLQQTAISEKNYKSLFRLNGEFVSLGEPLNIIRNKNTQNELSISIEFDSTMLYRELKQKLPQNFKEDYSDLNRITERLGTNRKKTKFSSKLQSILFDFMVSENETINLTEHDKINDVINKSYEIIKEINAEEFEKAINNSFYFRFRFNSGIDHFKQLRTDKDEYILTYKFLDNLSKEIKKTNFTIKYDIILKEKKFYFKSIHLLNDDIQILKIDLNNNSSNSIKVDKIESQLFDKNLVSEKTLNSLNEILKGSRTLFCFNKETIDSEKITSFPHIVSQILKVFIKSTVDYFENNNINYVSPIRAHPKRYYFLDKAKANLYVNTLDGDAIAEVLNKNTLLKNQVNSWFEKFNLKIKVEHMEDIIHKLQVNQNQLDLDITDVGFGISQILPVIMQGFLSKKDSLTLIEQPEIHLHPKMQADLADLFIDIIRSKSSKTKKAEKFLIIETHSEYLLRRLRRRISENKISAKDVAIYYITPPNSTNLSSEIQEKKVSQNGFFEYPKDFVDENLEKDIISFIKQQLVKD